MTETQSHGVALLVVDVQPTFLKVMPEPELFLRRCRLAVAAARLLGVHVIFTEQVPAKLGPTHPDLLAGGEGDPHVVGKSAFSALGAPGFRDLLRDRGIVHLLVCGLEGPVCVYQTAVEGLRSELGITLLSDAITSRRAEDQQACFAALRHAGAQVLPVETVFYAMLGSANHPQFRAFTEWVKNS
jgi:nicotinamidase-related amidase